MKRYYYLPKGCGLAFDIYAKNEKEVREKLRNLLDIKTLHGVQIWIAE